MVNCAQSVVIVVEDDPLNASLVQKMLKMVGIEQITVCNSGVEVRHAVVNLPNVDLILLDIQLPEEDGFAILHSLRLLPSVDQTKIVAITANVMPAHVERARKAGFDGFLGKPFKIDQFRSQLIRILDGQEVWEP
jgi:two-component system cell cycle response regulator DivK